MATDFGPFLQAAADEYAATQVKAATGPLNAQVTDLTGQLQSTAAQLAQAQAQIDALTPKPAQPSVPIGWRTSFFDDFTGPLNLDVWKVEDQVGYKRDQAWVSKSQVAVRDSCLVITAANLPTPINGRTVASGAVSTKGPKPVRQRGGRVEICAALPIFDAAWPAGWGRDDPAVGEIDIFEAVGLRSPIVQNVHENTNGVLPDGVTKTDHLGFDWLPPLGWSRADFHTYAVEWDADTGVMRWYVDKTLTFTATPASIGQPSKTPAKWLTGPAFSQPMALLLNLQVGGRMAASYGNQVLNPAQLDGGTGAQLRVDWVRFLTKA